MLCSSFKNVASISKLFACNFNMKQVSQTRSRRRSRSQSIYPPVRQSVSQLDCEYESCMQICRNDYFSLCQLQLLGPTPGERERERAHSRIFRYGTCRGCAQHFSTYIENARFCFILRAKLKLFDLHFNECNISSRAASKSRRSRRW